MIATTTRQQTRAIIEARRCVAQLDAAILEVAEELEIARSEAGRLSQQWGDIGEEMFAERALATDPFTPNQHAVKALTMFHHLSDRRLGLAEPRQAAAAQVTNLMKHLAFLHVQRDRWADRLAASEAGITVPEMVAELIPEPDASPEPVAVAVAPGSPAGPEGAPAPEPRRVRGWWGW